MQIQGLGQIALPATQIERATAFYRDVLGLPHLFSAPPGLSFFQVGATRLMLSQPEGGAGASIVYFKVSGIEAAFEHLKAGHAEIVQRPHLVAPMPDHDLWMGFFKDSEGNTLALMEEKAKA
jgi:methylmalonyl-CoA/ethylmalonyl-CoA epimerase